MAKIIVQPGKVRFSTPARGEGKEVYGGPFVWRQPLEVWPPVQDPQRFNRAAEATGVVVLEHFESKVTVERRRHRLLRFLGPKLVTVSRATFKVVQDQHDSMTLPNPETHKSQVDALNRACDTAGVLILEGMDEGLRAEAKAAGHDTFPATGDHLPFGMRFHAWDC